MAERIILPLDDESDDIVMRLPSEEATALHLLLSKLSYADMTEKGLSNEQAEMIGRITHVCY